MNREALELYRRLKRAECRLRWKGFIKKKPIFEVIGEEVEGSPELANLLNTNETLSRFLRIAGVNELKVQLLSERMKEGPEEEAGQTKYASEPVSEPKEVTWVVMAFKSYTLPIERLNIKRCKRDFVVIVKALSEISRIAKSFALKKLEEL